MGVLEGGALWVGAPSGGGLPVESSSSIDLEEWRLFLFVVLSPSRAKNAVEGALACTSCRLRAVRKETRPINATKLPQ